MTCKIWEREQKRNLKRIFTESSESDSISLIETELILMKMILVVNLSFISATLSKNLFQKLIFLRRGQLDRKLSEAREENQCFAWSRGGAVLSGLSGTVLSGHGSPISAVKNLTIFWWDATHFCWPCEWINYRMLG